MIEGNPHHRHVPELDGVRGLAILAVTLYRFSREFPTDTTLGWAFYHGLAVGTRGVDLFFVLSGFLITGVLMDAKSSAHRYRNFYARRSLRIFPLYFVALFLFVVVTPLLMGARNPFPQATEQQFYLWTYLSNVRMSWMDSWCFGRLDHFWSLAVEEHFYLIWPWIVFTVPDRWLFRVASIGFVATFMSRIAFAAVSSNGVAPDVLSWFRFDAMLIGAMLVIFVRQHAQSGALPVRYSWLKGLFVVSAICSLALAISQKRVLTITETSFAVTFALMLAIVLQPESTQGIARLFRLAPLRTLGKYSYAMYVFQSPLIALVALVPITGTIMGRLSDMSPVAAQLVYMVSMSLLTFVIALISWQVLEKHCLKLKRYFVS